MLRFGRRRVAHVLALKEHMDLAERRPLQLDAVPALDHQVVDLARTVGRLSEHDVQLMTGAAARAVVHDLVIGQRVERTLASERQDLPQRDGKRPDITLARELVLQTQRTGRFHRPGARFTKYLRINLG